MQCLAINEHSEFSKYKNANRNPALQTHSRKKCHIFVHFEIGQFSDKNVICVEMSIRIAKIPKIPRVSIYMATFEPTLVETL